MGSLGKEEIPFMSLTGKDWSEHLQSNNFMLEGDCCYNAMIKTRKHICKAVLFSLH